LDRALKQRLLGAVILTALLVILVPEWLDGAGHRARYPSQIELPETPEFVPMKEIMQPAPTVTASRDTESAPADAQPDNPVAAAKPAVKPGAASESKAAIDAWALQVGSFSEEKNAQVMRDQMRAKGYAAYIDHLHNKDTDQYRVRIGPELNRERVDKLRDDIEKQEKIKGLVVKHP
jgi:DedD protein